MVPSDCCRPIISHSLCDLFLHETGFQLIECGEAVTSELNKNLMAMLLAASVAFQPAQFDENRYLCGGNYVERNQGPRITTYWEANFLIPLNCNSL